MQRSQVLLAPLAIEVLRSIMAELDAAMLAANSKRAALGDISNAAAAASFDKVCLARASPSHP